ncbi:MAG: non-homologous end-joining DNA ligase [Acidimicrobiia bacterium]|nr:non-homologous end-joining DNA ligase [Acidimicrobiia bacterium]
MIRFGISHKPDDDLDDEAFLDDLVARGHTAFELGFTAGFPWKEKRCERFGVLAAERGIAVSIHAPYFAVLTIDDEDRSKQCVAAIEHTMKLGRSVGGSVICAHLGSRGAHEPGELFDMVRRRLDWVGSKVGDLDVALGLETSGTHDGFGTLGDITLLASEYPFVRPLIDWAHVHAVAGGALTEQVAFEAVFRFLLDQTEGWKMDPLQTQFSDNIFGPKGEIKHTTYGEGTLRVAPLVAAAHSLGIDMVMISESRDDKSHRAIQAEMETALSQLPVERGESITTTLSTPVRAAEVVPQPAGKYRLLHTPRPLTLSNLDKQFFPDGTTKGDLIQYYASVAPTLLPHLSGRPISMSRYPDGMDGPSFYEKRAPGHQPEWMRTTVVSSDSMGGEIDFLLAADRESLMWFANMGCIEVHPFHSRTGTLEFPDYAIFDFDPADGSEWDQVVTGGLLLRQALEGLGLRGYPKLSGARGLHVYAPLDPVHSYERVRRFVDAVGRLLAAANPDDITMELNIPKRRGKVFVDANRNAAGQTVASVYAVRPKPGAPVSVPITWDELGWMRNGEHTIHTIADRLETVGDLFRPVVAGGQTLDQAEAALGLG